MNYIDNFKKIKIAVIFTVFLRIILGLSIIYSGIPMVSGNRFSIIGSDTPVSFFFEAMYQTGVYWQFLGIAQIVTGVLLISQRYAALGALFFYPIILNIFIITISMNLTGKPYITFIMLLAGLYLLAWDYNKFLPIFKK